LLVELGDGIDGEVNDAVRALNLALLGQPPEAVIEVVPAYRSLLVEYDPLFTTGAALQQKLMAVWGGLDPSRLPEPALVEIPVVYGGRYGPDLAWVAEYHGLDAQAVIRLHAGTTYRVYMIGFTPGFPDLGELPRALETPRRETPRTRVPKGSVGIAQRQTGIYPTESPGGWQILGRTPVPLFDPQGSPPALLQAGDRVRFHPIDEEAFGQWTG
jgi:KipI family sensor histidine kinase inhibitor